MSQTFSHLGTDKLVYEHDKPHFLSGGGVTQEPGAMYMCCQALKDAEFLAWGRIKHIYVQNPSSCRSPVCSGGSWPSPSLVGMLPNVRACVQGERTAHRHVELHRDLGRKWGLGKSKCLRISVWVINIWVSPKLISALFCSLFQLCFLTFSTGSCVSQKVTQDQSDIISQVGQ